MSFILTWGDLDGLLSPWHHAVLVSASNKLV